MILILKEIVLKQGMESSHNSLNNEIFFVEDVLLKLNVQILELVLFLMDKEYS